VPIPPAGPEFPGAGVWLASYVFIIHIDYTYTVFVPKLKTKYMLQTRYDLDIITISRSIRLRRRIKWGYARAAHDDRHRVRATIVRRVVIAYHCNIVVIVAKTTPSRMCVVAS